MAVPHHFTQLQRALPMGKSDDDSEADIPSSAPSDDDFESAADSGSSDFEDDVVVKKKATPKKAAAAKTKPAAAKKGKENKEPAAKRKGKADAAATPAAKKAKPAADKPAKAAVVSDAKAVDIIKNYMLKANRPYSHLNVYDNLHGVVKKPSVPKILNQLCDDGVLQLKDFGKVRIYLANQSNFEEVDQSQMDAIDAEISELQERHSKRKEELKSIQSRVASLKSRPTLMELRDQVGLLRRELAEKEDLFSRLATADEPLISKEDFAKIRQQHQCYVKQWKQRRRACNEMLDCILENGTMKKADLEEEIGVENDASVGVNIIDHEPSK